MLRFALLLSAFALVAVPADAQVQRDYLRLDGPRFGLTYLPQDVVDQINDTFGDGRPGEDGDVIGDVPVVSQFGWQFERRFFETESGISGVTEWIPLIGGLERGLVLPSLTFLVGLRGQDGLEVGVGPNISGAGAGYALAAGFNNDLGGLNVPINLAAVFGRDGIRGSLLVGFNLASNGRRGYVPPSRPVPQPAPIPQRMGAGDAR